MITDDGIKRIALRIPEDLCRRIDAYRAKWERSAVFVGVRISRNQALVMLLERGLAAKVVEVRR